MTVRGLRKAYGTRVLVRERDLDVRAGEIVGLAGANGARKTTTVECSLPGCWLAGAALPIEASRRRDLYRRQQPAELSVTDWRMLESGRKPG